MCAAYAVRVHCLLEHLAMRIMTMKFFDMDLFLEPRVAQALHYFRMDFGSCWLYILYVKCIKCSMQSGSNSHLLALLVTKCRAIADGFVFREGVNADKSA